PTSTSTHPPAPTTSQTSWVLIVSLLLLLSSLAQGRILPISTESWPWLFKRAVQCLARVFCFAKQLASWIASACPAGFANEHFLPA
ncbi:hypothetical protein IWZ03DRAFT_408941, partial [Phyllosticta citriasiana]